MTNFFNAYHIGGRAGSVSFKCNNHLNHLIQEYIFEADKECEEMIKIKKPKAKVFSYCLDKECGFKDFYLNKNRYTSSFLKPIKDNLNFYQSINKKNMLLADACSPEKKIKLETFSLDYLLGEKKIEPIDFMSLDTQGSELDIIKGGINSIKKNIIALELEVSLINFYEKGPNFFEINKFLNENNFHLYKLEPLCTNFKYNIPNVTVRNKFPSQAEALYILNKDTITDNTRLEKLSFFSLLYGYTDIAFTSLKFLKEQNYKFFEDRHYLNFIEEFYKLVSDEDKNNENHMNNNVYNYSKEVSKVDKILRKFPNYYNYGLLRKIITSFFYDREYLRSKLVSFFNKDSKKSTKIESFYKKYDI